MPSIGRWHARDMRQLTSVRGNAEGEYRVNQGVSAEIDVNISSPESIFKVKSRGLACAN